jgi:hypothetical protein
MTVGARAGHMSVTAQPARRKTLQGLTEGLFIWNNRLSHLSYTDTGTLLTAHPRST